MCAIDHDGEPVQSVWQRAQQVGDIPRLTCPVLVDATNFGAERPLPVLADSGFDLVLDGVGELVAALGEELDPVVRHGVMRCGQHDPEGGAHVGGQEGHSRSRQHADVVDIYARGCQAGTHRGRQELAAGPGVSAHDGPGALALSPRRVAQHVRGGDREVERQLCGDRIVGQAAHTIGAEETCHLQEPSVWSWVELTARMPLRRHPIGVPPQ